MPGTITVKRAEVHEALHLKLEAMVRLAAGVGARQPLAPVPDEVRIRAESLLFECRPFALIGGTARGGRRGGVEPAAPTYGGLSAQLGAALAALDAFEDRHTHWDPALKCVVWRVAGDPLPVQRLNPTPVTPPPRSRQDTQIKRKLIDLIERSREGAYDNGYLAGYLAGAGEPYPHDEVPYPTHSSWSAGVETVHEGDKR